LIDAAYNNLVFDGLKEAGGRGGSVQQTDSKHSLYVTRLQVTVYTFLNVTRQNGQTDHTSRTSTEM